MSEKKILPGIVKDLNGPPIRPVEFRVPFTMDKRPLENALRLALKTLVRLGYFQTTDEIAACGDEPAALVREARVSGHIPDSKSVKR